MLNYESTIWKCINHIGKLKMLWKYEEKKQIIQENNGSQEIDEQSKKKIYVLSISWFSSKRASNVAVVQGFCINAHAHAHFTFDCVSFWSDCFWVFVFLNFLCEGIFLVDFFFSKSKRRYFFCIFPFYSPLNYSKNKKIIGKFISCVKNTEKKNFAIKVTKKKRFKNRAQMLFFVLWTKSQHKQQQQQQ